MKPWLLVRWINVTTASSAEVGFAVIALDLRAQSLRERHHLIDERVVRVLRVDVSLGPIEPRVRILRRSAPGGEVGTLVRKEPEFRILFDRLKPFCLRDL